MLSSLKIRKDWELFLKTLPVPPPHTPLVLVPHCMANVWNEINGKGLLLKMGGGGFFGIPLTC